MRIIYQLGFRVDLFPNDVPVVDCRKLINPYPEQGDKARDIVKADPLFEKIVSRAIKILSLNPSIVIACSFGIHRSGTVVEEILRRFPYDKIEIRKGIRSR